MVVEPVGSPEVVAPPVVVVVVPVGSPEVVVPVGSPVVVPPLVVEVASVPVLATEFGTLTITSPPPPTPPPPKKPPKKPPPNAPAAVPRPPPKPPLLGIERDAPPPETGAAGKGGTGTGASAVRYAGAQILSGFSAASGEVAGTHSTSRATEATAWTGRARGAIVRAARLIGLARLIGFAPPLADL